MRFFIGGILCFLVLSAGSVFAQDVVNPCGEGRFMDAKGTCYDCASEAGAPDVSFNETAQALCSLCGNRTVVNNTCRLNMCASGHFLRDETGACRDCRSAESFFVGDDRTAQDLCRACGNREVTPHGRCRLTREACRAAHGFYDENDMCVSCDYPHRVALGNNKSAFDACAACGNRETAVGGVCRVKASACRRGQKFAGAHDACYDCLTDEAVDIGKNVTLHYACAACPNRFVTPTGLCVKAVCGAERFMDMYGVCHPCDGTADVFVGGDGRLEKMCLACAGRFVADGYCRRI